MNHRQGSHEENDMMEDDSVHPVVAVVSPGKWRLK
jgi:hypothetical protein